MTSANCYDCVHLKVCFIFAKIIKLAEKYNNKFIIPETIATICKYYKKLGEVE